jgi:catechol 2,3-dioxygenase-like lactoylglutathione lyase family enzyme
MDEARVAQDPTPRPALVTEIAHTGLTVPDLDASLRMWCAGLGFTLERSFTLDEDVVRRTTGVTGAQVHAAVVRLGDQRVELLQYDPPTAAAGLADPGAHGATHIALTVTDLDRTIAVCADYGWQPVGPPHELPQGPRAGTRIIYLRGAAGGLLELMQPAGHVPPRQRTPSA